MIRDFVRFALDILTWLIIGRAILSWFPSMRGNRVYRSLVELTETFVAPVRRILPSNNSMIDFAPLVTIFILQLLENILLSVI